MSHPCVRFDHTWIQTLANAEGRSKFLSDDPLPVTDVFSLPWCPLFFQAMYPYWLTYKNGGDFAWDSKKDSVAFQCGNPIARVQGRLERGPAKMRIAIEAKVPKLCSYSMVSKSGALPERFSKLPEGDLISLIPFFMEAEAAQSMNKGFAKEVRGLKKNDQAVYMVQNSISLKGSQLC